jgi:hypothetical protein
MSFALWRDIQASAAHLNPFTRRNAGSFALNRITRGLSSIKTTIRVKHGSIQALRQQSLVTRRIDTPPEHAGKAPPLRGPNLILIGPVRSHLRIPLAVPATYA